MPEVLRSSAKLKWMKVAAKRLVFQRTATWFERAMVQSCSAAAALDWWRAMLACAMMRGVLHGNQEVELELAHGSV
jgi:hypothetical protein